MNRQYLVIIEDAPHNFAAYSPDLPGCIVTGRTREETLAKMRDAVALHLEGLEEDGQPIPPGSTTAEFVTL